MYSAKAPQSSDAAALHLVAGGDCPAEPLYPECDAGCAECDINQYVAVHAS